MNKPKTPEHVIYTLKTGTNYGSWSSVQPAYVKDVIPYIPQSKYLELEEKCESFNREAYQFRVSYNELQEKLNIAQEALIRTRFLSAPINLGAYDIARIFHLAEEALSKLQTKGDK